MAWERNLFERKRSFVVLNGVVWCGFFDISWSSRCASLFYYVCFLFLFSHSTYISFSLSRVGRLRIARFLLIFPQRYSRFDHMLSLYDCGLDPDSAQPSSYTTSRWRGDDQDDRLSKLKLSSSIFLNDFLLFVVVFVFIFVRVFGFSSCWPSV